MEHGLRAAFLCGAPLLRSVSTFDATSPERRHPRINQRPCLRRHVPFGQCL